MEPVKITDLSLRPYNIPYRTDSSWTPGKLSSRVGMIVVARAEDGTIGLGEIAPLMMFSMETHPETESLSRAALEKLSGMDIPRDFHSLCDLMDDPVNVRISRAHYLAPSALFGIETALADLGSRMAGLPLARWINRDALTKVPVNAILTGSAEDVERTIRKKMAAGFTTYKIKVGSGSLEEDLERVAAARRLAGEQAVIRLDANRAWDYDHAVEALDRLRTHQIEYIEEPLNDSLLAEIPKLSGVDIALDETVMQEEWLERLSGADSVGAVIIRPSIAGGIAKSLELARRVRELRKKAVVTSLFESGVGLAACVHLAAAIGGEIPPCGLDTLGYLEDSLILEGLPVRNARIEVPRAPGLGVTLKREIPGG